jgi:molecular chaperone GrpE (heat shock protein)
MFEAVSDPAGETAMLPVLKQRAIGESEYQALVARAAEVEKLNQRIADLERALVTSETRLLLRRDPVDDLLGALLPTLDDFERALAAARAKQDHQAILDGVELVRMELLRVLRLYEVERIPVAPGDPFDPSFHQTLSGDGDELFPPEAAVGAELRAGFRRGKKVLRRAIVRLAGEGEAEP